MRGYFGIGVERVSKPMNMGALFRTANAFGAAFVFTVDAAYAAAEGGKADTSDVAGQVPFYAFPDARSMVLPANCALVGVELLDDAAALPSFRHPRAAAYVLGPERGELSAEMRALCAHTVQIPTRFSLNVGIAGALVMYDRLASLGGFPPRPLIPGGATRAETEHVYGDPVRRRRAERHLARPPAAEEN